MWRNVSIPTTARMMFANSEFLLLFTQSASDQQELSKLLRISKAQMDHISTSQVGMA